MKLLSKSYKMHKCIEKCYMLLFYKRCPIIIWFVILRFLPEYIDGNADGSFHTNHAGAELWGPSRGFRDLFWVHFGVFADHFGAFGPINGARGLILGHLGPILGVKGQFSGLQAYFWVFASHPCGSEAADFFFQNKNFIVKNKTWVCDLLVTLQVLCIFFFLISA